MKVTFLYEEKICTKNAGTVITGKMMKEFGKFAKEIPRMVAIKLH